MHALLDGELGAAKILLRDVINASVGFEQPGRDIGIPGKSLMRMFGPAGNPRAGNVFAATTALKDVCHLQAVDVTM